MSTATALTTQQKPGVLASMANRLNVEPTKLLSTLKETVFRGASDTEMMALCIVANEYGLNPLTRQIHAFKSQAGIVPVVGVDGWIALVNRQKEYNGCKFEMEIEETGRPISCTCNIFVKGRDLPVSVTEYFSECYRKTEPWDRMPMRMLRHKAFIQCARLAFGLTGIFDEDEAIDIQASPPTFAAREETSNHSLKEESTSAPPVREPSDSPQSTLEQFISSEGFNFDDLQRWAVQSGMAESADSWAGFGDVPAEVAKRWLRAKAGLKAQLSAMKGAQ